MSTVLSVELPEPRDDVCFESDEGGAVSLLQSRAAERSRRLTRFWLGLSFLLCTVTVTLAWLGSAAL